MSTKIYNGYKMINLRADELVEFIKALREQMKPMFYEAYCEAVANKCKDLIRCSIKMNYDFDGSEDSVKKTETFIKKWYRCSISHERIFANNADDIQSIISEVEHPFCGGILNMAINILKSQHSWSQRFFTIDLRSEIAFVSSPHGSRKLLFLAYGDEFINVLNKLIESNNDFIQKYHIQRYSYWNNTDRPDNVSPREWKQREKDWDRALPTSAARCGLCTSDIFNSYDLYDIFKMAEDGRAVKITKMIPSMTDIIAKLTNELTMDHFIRNDPNYDEKSYHEWFDLNEVYGEKFKEGDPKMTAYAEKVNKELLSNSPQGPMNIIVANNILDFLSRYMLWRASTAET